MTPKEQTKINEKYQAELNQIKKLIFSIQDDCKRFADQEHQSPWFGELGKVKMDLEEIREFTKQF